MKLTSAKHEFLADDVESLVLEKKGSPSEPILIIDRSDELVKINGPYKLRAKFVKD